MMNSDLPGLIIDWLSKRLSQNTSPSPFLLGLSGLQGSGKSTLASALIDRLSARDISAVTLSLDDVYHTRAHRQHLAQTVHPLLVTRGVPGTHDLPLLHSTLDALTVASPVQPAHLPRFDKGLDDRTPVSSWETVGRPPRIIILEGWCAGVPPQSESQLPPHQPAGAGRRQGWALAKVCE